MLKSFASDLYIFDLTEFLDLEFLELEFVYLNIALVRHLAAGES